MRDPDCVFCDIVAGVAPADMVRELPDAVAIRPHHPVTPGHILVLPRVHVRDASESTEVTSMTFGAAALTAVALGIPHYNLITSVGAPATQTVLHLHVHVVPRLEGDGLKLPWTGQKKDDEAPDRTWSTPAIFGPHCGHDGCSWTECDQVIGNGVLQPCRSVAVCPYCGPTSDQWPRISTEWVAWCTEMYGTASSAELRHTRAHEFPNVMEMAELVESNPVTKES